MMTKFIQISLVLLSGVLLGLSWPEITEHTWLIFFAFIPIYYLIDTVKWIHWRKLFLMSFVSFFMWHILAVYWMIYSTIIGAVTAWLVNSFIMAGIIIISAFSASRLRKIPIEIILAFFWLSFEIMHLAWSLSWPWMNLGNVFANKIEWIQWYEFVGIYGGSFWIILVNGLFYRILKAIFIQNFKLAMVLTLFTFTLIFLPILLSHYQLTKDREALPTIQMTVSQPNIDTYKEKFDKFSPLRQSQIIINQLDSTNTSDLIILPETAIPKNFNSNKRPYPESIQSLLNWSKQKNKTIIGGFNTKDSADSYNSALQIEEGEILGGRNKIKLLPFGEKMPFEWIYKVFQEQIAKDGGNSFGYGRDTKARVFQLNKPHNPILGVLICFESVFPDINCEMVRNGAQSLIIITNDDWWNDSPGHRQHFAYARLRAIENRRSVVRSANTGISGFIDEYGRIIKQTMYKKEALLSQSIPLNHKITLFSKYEREFRWLYVIISILILGLSMVHWLVSLSKKTK